MRAGLQFTAVLAVSNVLIGKANSLSPFPAAQAVSNVATPRQKLLHGRVGRFE